MLYNIYHDVVIQASTAKVFEAITDPNQLVHWWPLKCSGTPEINAEYNFFFTDEYDWWGKVIALERNQAFHIQMTKSDADWDPTEFGFDLEEQTEGTLVRFSHTGWKSCNAHFRRTSYCWAILLMGLKNYLEKGVVVPFEDRA